MVMMLLVLALTGIGLGMILRRASVLPWLSPLLNSVRDSAWFRSPWKCGLAIFLYNAILFGFFSFLALFSLVTHPLIGLPMVVLPAVTLSLFAWMWVGANWRGDLWERLKVALTGSGFYWVMVAFFGLRIQAMPEAPHPDDLFMEMIGLMMGATVGLVAGSLCLLILIWPRHTTKRAAY